MTTDNIAFPGLVFPGVAPPARSYWSRGGSWLLVALIHFLFFAMLSFSVRMPTYGSRSALETILLLPSLEGRNAPQVHMLRPQEQSEAPPEIQTAPITLPKPPPPPPERAQKATPGDVLRAVGEDLSCGAGSYENLTQTERSRCRHEPWRAARIPNGSLVMVPASILPRLADTPPDPFHISGADAQRHALQVAPTGCPVMLNIPCLNNIPHDNN